jgi:serine/threonine-protein kinase
MNRPPSPLGNRLAERYHVERELGEGGMATVYLADDVRHGRKVAIKVIRAEVAAALGTERFLAEIKLTASLQHPHILGLIDSGVVPTADGAEQPFYVMPYVTGETLRARLAREGAVPIADALSILAEVADALASAHQHGIVHRDIKPENVLLGQGHAMVADFGVAKALHRSIEGTNITGTGIALGTPAYMAPEQAVGDPGVDHRADLYALGVVAFELVTGRTPFVGPNIAGMVKAMLTEPAPLLTKSVPACPPRLSALVDQMLAKDPAARPQTAAAVRDALRSIHVDLAAIQGTATRSNGSQRARVGLGLGIAATAIIAIAIWRPWTTAPSHALTRDAAPRSIAVLPFDNMNHDSTTDYFSDGMSEELISALGRLRGLRVASRTSTFAMKGQLGVLSEVGRRLGVQSVLEGSVRRFGDQIRVTARLVDVERDSTLWDGEYNSHLRNVLFVQDTIARAIVSALSVALSEPGAGLARPRSGDPDAYDAYLRGRYFLGRRNPASIASAIRSFDAAIARDSSFALAYAGLADAYSLAAPFGGRRPHDVFPLARAAATRALALDSTVAEAHTSLGIVSMFYDWDWTAAGKHLLRGVELNPSYAEGHLFYSWYLLLRGQSEQSLSEIAKAHELDQLSVVITTRRGTLLQYENRDAEAIPFFRAALELDSTFFMARIDLAAAYLRTGQRELARRNIPRDRPFPGAGEAGFPGWMLIQLGDTAGGIKALQDLEAVAKERYVTPDAIAMIYVALGDTTRALDLLERGANERAFTLVFLGNYPTFDGLHHNERFRRLANRIGVVLPP